MQTFGYILGIILIIAAVIILSLAGWYFILILRAVVEGARELEPTVYVPLFVTVLTATLGLSGTLYIQWGIRKREIEAAHRERKLEIYLEFMKLVENILASSNEDLDEEPMPRLELVKQLLSIRTRAILWASPSVLTELVELARPNKTTKEMFQNIDRLQRAMRVDLGLSNRGLNDTFFTRIMLKDPSELDNLK